MTTEKKTRAPKQKLTATTATLRAAEPQHHFFASSMGTWRVSYDVHQLIADMISEKLPFNVWLVNGAKDREYEINWYAPVVDDKTWIGAYFFQ